MGRAKKQKPVQKAPLIRFLGILSDYRQGSDEMPTNESREVERLEMLARAALVEIKRRDSVIEQLADRIHTLEFAMGITDEEESKINFEDS